MQEHLTYCKEPWALRQALSTDGGLRIAVPRITVRPLGWAMRFSYITVIVFLTAVLSKQAYAQNASTKPNVTQETRAKVDSVRLKHPEFKLSPDAQLCFEGKLIDPECDPTIYDEADIFERKRALAENKRELAEMARARNDCGIAIGSAQIGLLVFEDRPPSKEASFIGRVMDEADTPMEVKRLFKDYLGRKERREKFTKQDSERLMALADKHLDSAQSLLLTQTDPTFKQQLTAMISEASKSLSMVKQMLTKRTGP